jgi:hypothetical protein
VGNAHPYFHLWGTVMRVPANVFPLPNKVYNKSEVSEIEQTARELAQLGGIIIISVSDNKLWYCNHYGFWTEFGQQTRAEDPLTYVRVSAAIRRIRLLFAETHETHMQLALWIHPDAGVPLEKYQRMTGNHFPGSPRN